MANLTGQQIQSTYPGLLNLATATTGITSTLQAVQDGLGNNTGVRIATNNLFSPNIMGTNYLKPDYMGVGFTAAGVTPVALTQNKLLYESFYDSGLWSYSAITYNVVTGTTIGDVITGAFYTLQLVPTIGFAPADLIMSGITLTVSSSGVKTTTLPSTLSFSGYGSQLYCFVYKIANSGATPTVRLAASTANGTINVVGASLGYYFSAAGTVCFAGSKNGQFGTISNSLNTANFQTSFTSSDITTQFQTLTMQSYGFTLNVI